MKIPNEKLQDMYAKVGIKKEDLHNALRKMGKKHLKGKLFKDKWTPNNPTKNYCYVVAEFVYFYLSPENSVPYKLKGIPGDDGIHRFIKFPDGEIIDLAVEQFDNYEVINYELAQKSYFLQTGCTGPSKRTRLLAELMGYGDITKDKKLKKEWS